MNQIITSKEEPLYRFIEKVHNEPNFHKAIMDVMVGLNSERGAPFFLDVYQNLEWLMCSMFIEQNQSSEIFQDVSSDELNTYIGVLERFQNSDSKEVEIVKGYMSMYDFEVFQTDLFKFLQYHRYSFFVKHKKYDTRRESDLYNDPMHGVW